MKSAKKELKNFDKRIKRLEIKKKEMIKQKDIVFCPECQKFYPENKCKNNPYLSMEGGFLEAWYVTCPKGHVWDDKED